MENNFDGSVLDIYYQEMAEINHKYNFQSSGRSSEDKLRFANLSKIVRDYIDKWDREHPLTPCVKCGGRRVSSLNNICVNWGKCDLAPYWGG